MPSPLKTGTKLLHPLPPQSLNGSTLEYINETSEYGITFQRGTSSSISLEVFADADYASKATDRRSVSGGVIMCGGAIVYWFS